MCIYISNILGFYSYLDRTGGIGYFGLEEAYDSQLSGTPQEVFLAFDPQRLSTVEEVPPGTTLILTLDREIQALTEKTLDEARVLYRGLLEKYPNYPFISKVRKLMRELDEESKIG